MELQRSESRAMLATRAMREMAALWSRRCAVVAGLGLAVLWVAPPRVWMGLAAGRAARTGVAAHRGKCDRTAPPSGTRVLASAHGITGVRSLESGANGVSPAAPFRLCTIGLFGDSAAAGGPQWTADDRLPLTYHATAPPSRLPT